MRIFKVPFYNSYISENMYPYYFKDFEAICNIRFVSRACFSRELIIANYLRKESLVDHLTNHKEIVCWKRTC